MSIDEWGLLIRNMGADTTGYDMSMNAYRALCRYMTPKTNVRQVYIRGKELQNWIIYEDDRADWAEWLPYYKWVENATTYIAYINCKPTSVSYNNFLILTVGNKPTFTEYH